MRYVVRVFVIALALVVVYLTPVVAVSSASGTAVQFSGVLIDAVAVAAIAAGVLTWRKRTATA